MNNNAESNLYDLLVTQDLEPEILDSSGRPVTDPTQAELFSFNWKTENHDYGTVVVLVGQDNQLEVYFGDNLGRTMEADDKSQWYDFLHQLKSFASRNMLTFEINNINRLKYTMQGMAAIKEGLFEGYYGRKNVSYSDEPKQVRLMIKHNRNIGEGEARHRAIESLFVETADGERFKLPFRNLIGGRVMARHCAEGGNPYDAFGQHICEMVTEMNTLARFVRASRGKTFATETTGLVDSAVRHYQDLKDKAKRMIGQRGYHEEREIYDPAAATGSELTVESIREMFIERNIDQRIEEALPILARLAKEYKEENMKEVNEFESWTNQVVEGTWALPDSSEAETKLKELMSKPLIVGADATNATEQLYDLVGDDELFDRLGDLAKEDPNANCWDDPAVMDRLNELGVDTSMGPGEADAAGDAEALADPEMGPQTQPKLADQVGEGFMDTVKKVGGKVLDKLGHGSDEDLLKDLQRKAGIRGAEHGKPSMAYSDVEKRKQGVSEQMRNTGDDIDDMVEDYLDYLESVNMMDKSREEEKAEILASLEAGHLHSSEIEYALSGTKWDPLAEQGVTEGAGYDGSEPLDLSTNPSVNDVFKRALYIYDYEGYGNDMDYSEDDAIDQYVARKFGQDVLNQLNKARYQSYFGRDDGKGPGGGGRTSNLGTSSAPGGNFRTTKAGVMNKQDAKMMKARVADRLGRHPEPNLPEQAEDDIARLRRLSGQRTTEELDTDGVMMTRPSNMSS